MWSRVASITIFLALAAATSADGGELRIEVRGLAAKTGTVNVGLFKDAESFPKAPLSGQRIPAGPISVIAVFPDLAAGDYAVSAFHDVNDNGKLDTNLLGRPVEPFGFSRDASGSMGPPAFDAARIAIGAESQSIVINLR